MDLRIEVLGPLRVTGPGEIELVRSSHRRLLSILVLDANRSLATAVLIDRLWDGEPPKTARASLQMHVSALRKLLPAGTIVTETTGYRLDLDEHGLDAADFQWLATESHRAARRMEWEPTLATAESALSMWRGDPYPDLVDDEFAQAEIKRLEELCFSLVELRTEALLELGRAAEALPDLEQLVVAHPLRGRLWEQLMRARYRLGRNAEALGAYRQAWAAFAEIGLEPSGSLRRLEREILLHGGNSTAQVPNNLPVELTQFVGRESESTLVRRLLDEGRLVTLTGVGGAGKTRLALRVALQTLDVFRDGCWLVELAPVREDELVPLEVAGAIGLRAHEEDVLSSVTAAIRRDEALIVLDNCEHVLPGAAAVVRALLEACPHVKVLATSREPLKVPGEFVFDVPPLPFPATDDGQLMDFDAVRLFDERASRVRPSFVIDGASSAAVGRICRQLDGIPLAIELAAAKVGSMSPETIAERLDHRFRILKGGSSTGPERHRTLEAAFDWSYELLDEREQALFARLGVFAGSFALDTAEAVCAGGVVEAGDVVSLLAALVDKSLLSSVEVGTSRRYRLIETMREYARARLEGTEAAGVSRKHIEWFTTFATGVATGVHGAGRWELFERLDAESDNLEAALAAALAEGSDAEADALAHALAWHALDHGQLTRCITHLGTSLERATGAQSEAATRALLGTSLFLAGREDDALVESRRASELASELEPSARNVAILTTHARLHVLHLDHDPREAIPLGLRALDMAEASDDPFAVIYARRSLGRTLAWSGEHDAGIEHYQDALDLALSTGDRAMTLETYESYFVLLYLHPEARRTEPKRIAEEMLERFPPEEKRWGRYTPADWLPTVFLSSGEWERAEEAIDRLGARHLEGWDQIGYLLSHASLRWMQGRLDEAQFDLDELEPLEIDVQWFHTYFPLLADLAADRGRLTTVREVATACLSLEVHSREEAKKLGTLCSLVRAEIDEALTVREDETRAEHVERAQAAVKTARSLLERFPPSIGGSLQWETPVTYLALAEAELSRVTGPDPALWQRTLEIVDSAYFRLYAGFRLTEALYDCGHPEEAHAAFQIHYPETRRIGADRLQSELEALTLGRRDASRAGA
ncbi:MAG TPA: BTAD domain-containing putative transcriptional regulator [Gaiellaceae bacterium]|nr:BTAD domain-containing putative transcriptional regulator [Gaiellaceae bacterium]